MEKCNSKSDTGEVSLNKIITKIELQIICIGPIVNHLAAAANVSWIKQSPTERGLTAGLNLLQSGKIVYYSA